MKTNGPRVRRAFCWRLHLPELAALAVLALATDPARAQAPDLDLRWRGVALADLPGAELAELAEAVRIAKPARFDSVLSVAWLERTVALQESSSPKSADLEGAARHLVQIVGRHARFATELEPGTPATPPLGVAVVEARLPLAQDLCDWPEFRVLREAPLATLDLELAASLSDRTVLVSDDRFGFARVYPAGVGAIDEVRRPGYVSSLTPVTEHGRLSRDARTASLHAPAWNRGKPYLPLEIPYAPRRAGGERRWYVETRVAFHIWQGQRFMRGFNSYGCITLRDEDLDELAAVVFARPAPLPLAIRALAFADHRHPFPDELTHHWQLDNLGTAEHPRLTRGILYAIKKVMSAPPGLDAMVGIFMSWERQRDPLGPVAWTPSVPPSLTP